MKRSKLYILAGLTSIMLYAVGIFTGTLIYSYTESKTSQELSKLHSDINNYNNDLESIEFQQLYLASDQKELGCKFIVASLDRVQNDLNYFWQKLPGKLEVYEKYNTPDESYENLKKRYMTVSLKAWLLSLSVKEKCGGDILPILYFYSANCEGCIEQGLVLDRLRNSTNILVYTLDLNLDLEAISVIKETYRISGAPALVINGKAYQGLISYEQLSALIRREGSGLYL